MTSPTNTLYYGDNLEILRTYIRDETVDLIYLDSTRQMTQAAVTAGYYHSDLWQKDYPRIQILTIVELLNNAEVKMPPSATGAFQRTQRATKSDATQGTLDL